MFRGIGFGAEKLGLLALDYPRRATVLLCGLLILIGISLPQVSFDDDIHRAFLSDSPLSQAQLAFDAAQSPPETAVMIYVTSPDAIAASGMMALRDLSLDFSFVEGVTGVASPFALRWPPDAASASGAPLFPPQIDAGFVDDLAAFAALETGLPTFLNSDRSALLLSVSINTAATTVAAAIDGINAEIARSLPDGMVASITGEDAISAEIVAGLKDDLIALNVWGVAIVTLVALLILRDMRMVMITAVPALLGGMGVLGLSVWLSYPITVLSNVIPILLLVLGMADCVHLTGHLKESGDIRHTIKTVGPACALTALTTAAAFASITLTGNAQLFEFAILGASGTLLTFVIVIVAFALLGRVVRFSDKEIPAYSGQLAQWVARIGAGYPRRTAVTCLLVLGVTTIGFVQTKSWFPLYQNLPGSSETRDVNDAIAADFGGVFQMVAETDGDWSTVQQLTEILEGMAGAGSVLSELSFARWLGHPDQRPTAAEKETLPAALVDRLQSDDGVSRIFVAMPEPMRSDATLAQFDAMYDAALANGADRVLGLPTIMRFEAVSLIQQLSYGLTAAAIGATVIVALAFRSIALVPVLIIPNTLPLMVTGASLHLWAQGQLSPTAVLALTIAFGIAIDDTVHFLSRYQDARATGLSAAKAVASSARSAGQVLVLTTVLLTCGLSVTLLSDFLPIRLFGTMMIITLWAALLVDLLLLPALLTWRKSANADR